MRHLSELRLCAIILESLQVNAFALLQFVTLASDMPDYSSPLFQLNKIQILNRSGLQSFPLPETRPCIGVRSWRY